MRIGIDLGGTKIEGVALADDGREIARRRVPTPRDDYEGTLSAIAALVDELERAAGSGASRHQQKVTIGVGIPGAISRRTGLVKNANSTWLNGRPLDRDLQARLHHPIRLANDANCFALSEAADGAGAGARVVFGVIIGTGTGGGVVVDGAILEGPNRIAGEWGHNPLPWPDASERPGPACYCGLTGCIETFLSGPGLARDHERGGGARLSAEEVASRAAQREPAAAATLARYHSRMARALASVINVLDPDVIVLGGGLSHIESLYTEVPRLWDEFVFSDAVETELIRARHGDASGVRGAAWLWTTS
ncbi:MAG TPA: ROK family protein [Vicinamibacterales bacterium]|jgi:fructokinase|nr:ROK family protein [Vicinamibacterales bacterium]